MKLKLTSPVWSGGGLLLAAAFLVWAAFLLVAVRQRPLAVAELTGFVVLACVLVLGGVLFLTVCQRSLVQLAQSDAALAHEVAERRRVEHELRSSENRFRALLEHSSDVVLVLQPDGTIVFDEPRKGRILGYASGGFLGHSVFELLHPDDHPLARSLLDAVLQSAEPHRAQFRARHQDGTWRWLEAVVTNLLHEPSVAGIVVNYRDVTERKRAEEALRASEEQFRAIFELAAVGIVQVDSATRRFLRFNDAFCRIVGRTPEQLAGLTFVDITHPDDQATGLTSFQRLMDGTIPVYTAEKRYVRSDGESVWAQITATTIRDDAGRPLRTITVVEDVTERRRAADVLRKALGELDLKVRERTSELLAANAALREEVDQRRRTEEALRDSQALYHSLVENLPMSIYRKDREGHILFANREWCKTRGQPLERLLGKTVYELFPVSLAEKYARDDEELLRTGREYHTVEEHQTGQGKHIHVEVFKTAVRDHRGQIVGTQGAFWDVTEQKRAHETLTQERLLLRTLINHLPDYIFVKDAVSRFLLNNPAHLRVLGASTQEEVHGKTDFDFFSAYLARSYYEDEQQVIQSGQPLLDREEYTVSPSGETQWLLTTKVPLRNSWGQVTGLVGISRDITRLKQVEDKLRRAHEELERRVEERTAELASSNADLARSNAELAQFAYIASHDLQEPLRAVAGCVTLLQQRVGDQLDARATEFMRHAVEGATRMQTLINDLLTYSRVGTRGQPVEDADCAAVLRGVLVDLAPAVQESGATVTHDPLPVVAADPTQLQQLFQNLLSNAVKFRGSRTPEIHVGAQAENGCWHFTVSDNGIGIEPRYFERIFRVFQRLHTRREYVGNGIGLAICKKIVERHGGQIWVQSTPGRGSTFHFTFPNRR